MTELNRSGNRRGMTYEPRFARCKLCGELYWKETARREYCDGCREAMVEIRKEQHRIRAREDYKKKRAEDPFKGIPKPPEPETGFKPNECLISHKCRYGVGTKPGCDYYYKTGRLRTIEGKHQIVEGRCDLYEPKRKGEAQGWQRTRNRELFGGEESG